MLLRVSGNALISIDEKQWFMNDGSDIRSHVHRRHSREFGQLQSQTSSPTKDEIKKLIAKALMELPDREKQVLILYYYEGLTLKEIGSILAVTESRVSQLHTKAVMRLRGKLEKIKEGFVQK